MGKHLLVIITLFVAFGSSVIASNNIYENNNSILVIESDKDTVKAEVKVEDEKEKDFVPFSGMRWDGFVRTFFYYRDMQNQYENMSGGSPNGTKWYSVNGGYAEPFMRINGRANPVDNLYIDVEYTFDNLLTGQGAGADRGKVSLPLQGLRFGGTYNTDYGKFLLMTGGVYWYNITSLTFGGFDTRYDPFERVAWEWEGDSWKRYSMFFESGGRNGGAVGAGSRFGSAATQGFLLEGKDLPLGLNAKMVYGKTDKSGGYQAWQERNPKKVQVYHLDKAVGNTKIGLTYFNSFGNSDVYNNETEDIKMITSDFKFKFGEITLSGEAGVGNYEDPEYKADNYGKVINTFITSTKHLTGLPIGIQVYYVDSNVVNPNSEMINTSVSTISNTYGESSKGFYIQRGSVTDLGKIANNRKGVNLFLKKHGKKFRVDLGLGVAEELDNMYDAITFDHRLNKVTRSKFHFFRQAVGPYNRLYSQYLTVYENVNILPEFSKDSSDYKKGFTTLETSLRYKGWLCNKPLVLSNYTNYSSVQDGVKFLPYSGDGYYLTTLYNEFTAYYHVSDKFTIVGLVGHERSKGSDRTEHAYAETSYQYDAFGNVLFEADGSKAIAFEKGDIVKDQTTGLPTNEYIYVDENGNDVTGEVKTLDQKGYAYGLGIDYAFTERAGIFIRTRWFNHEDLSFTKDKFKGFETSIEFKVFF